MGYVAPEILQRKAYNGFTADLWSAGVVGANLFAGLEAHKKLSTDDVGEYEGAYRSSSHPTPHPTPHPGSKRRRVSPLPHALRHEPIRPTGVASGP